MCGLIAFLPPLRQELERFRKACERGYISDINRYKDMGLNLDATLPQYDYATGLMRASAMRRSRAVVILLDAGASFDIRDSCNRTVAHYAAKGKSDDPGVLEVLKARGVPLWLPDKFNRTPLHYGAFMGSLKICTFLMANVPPSVNPHSANSHRKTPADLAAEQGHDAVVDLLRGTVRCVSCSLCVCTRPR